MKLRDYQIKALDEIRGLFRQGHKKVLLQAATGSGKTAIFCEIAKSAEAKNTRAVIVVRGKSLVDQASRRLTSYGVNHGVLMANDPRFAPEKMIQVVSIDTCNRRGKYPEATLVVVDEAHLATSDSFKKFLSHYENSFVVSVTATPWVETGLMHLVSNKDCVVYPISLSELIDQGFLVRPKYFASSSLDLSKIGLKNGDYDENHVTNLMKEKKVEGHVIENYKKNCTEGRTFLFAVNIDHANFMAKSFEKQGISSVVITGDTPMDKRMDLIYANQLIISVGTLTTGVDVPDLRNLILCRPTQSRNLYVQMLGRGTRPFEGKTHFNVFDHVSNIETHGFIEDEEKASPEPFNRKRKKAGDAPVKVCPECMEVLHARILKCTCGYEFEKEKSVKKLLGKGFLVEIDNKEFFEERKFKAECNRILNIAWKFGWKKGAIYHRLVDKFGEEKFKKHRRYYEEVEALYDRWFDKQDAVNDHGFRLGWAARRVKTLYDGSQETIKLWFE